MSEPSAATAPKRPRQFHLLFMCLLVIGAGNSMLLAVAPPLVRQLGLSDSSVGWIFSLSALLWVFCSPHWGRTSDQVGRKPIAALGLAAYAVSMGSFGLVVLLGLNGLLAGFWLFALLMLARAIFGAFGSATSPAAQAYVADRTSRIERTEQLAGLSAAFAVGQAFGPGVAAALLGFGILVPIVLVTIMAAAASFAVWRFLPETTPPKTEQRGSDWKESLVLAGDRRLSGYLIYGFGLSLISGITVQIFGLFTMDRLDVSGTQGAEYAAAGFMANALAFLATQLGILPRLKMTPRALMAWGAGLFAVGVGIQILAPTLGALMVALAVQGIGGGLARAGFAGGSSIAVRPDEQGAAAGLVVAINGAGFVFSPLLGGVVYENAGMDAPLYITMAILIGMIVFTLRSRRLRTAIPVEQAAEPPTQPQ